MISRRRSPLPPLAALFVLDAVVDIPVWWALSIVKASVRFTVLDCDVTHTM